MRRQRESREHFARQALLRQYDGEWPQLEAEAFATHKDSERLIANLREIDMDAIHAKRPVRRWWQRVFQRGAAA